MVVVPEQRRSAGQKEGGIDLVGEKQQGRGGGGGVRGEGMESIGEDTRTLGKGGE